MLPISQGVSPVALKMACRYDESVFFNYFQYAASSPLSYVYEMVFYWQD